MKIHQLPLGARFEYEGEEYVKTGPLFAAGKTGQRLIPKYAILKPLDPVAPAKAPPPQEVLSRADVLRAFEAFYTACTDWVPRERQEALHAARDRFLNDLTGH